MLAKRLYAQKRKGKAPGGSSKRMKVGASSSMAPAITAAASKIVVSAEVLPTAEVGTVDADSMPFVSPGPSSGDQALKFPTEGEMREEKKEKKAIAKTPCKAHFSELNDDSDERGEDPFDDPEIVQALIHKFAMPKVVDCMADLELWQLIWGSLKTLLQSGHQILAHIKRAHHLKAEAEKVQEDF
ncbi:hypothetical protein COCNU_13G007920 [Cocos nucifera]|uniref:Uncharacterized protein n=1 Tax=Cocos nucifera TaxID=13894 RepID=A0A8K0ITF9_COCNU|nr:hypothetical protein COCNU_13G007920 [Cocos nucifera]